MSLSRSIRSVRPEPVEGRSLFSFAEEGEGRGFDKLSPNGLLGSMA
jgi:hypothetical protein